MPFDSNLVDNLDPCSRRLAISRKCRDVRKKKKAEMMAQSPAAALRSEAMCAFKLGTEVLVKRSNGDWTKGRVQQYKVTGIEVKVWTQQPEDNLWYGSMKIITWRNAKKQLKPDNNVAVG